MTKEVYSLGTSNRSIEEFINILKVFRIQKVVDVRRFPTSKFSHFKKYNLEKILKRENIDYVYMGDSLGGYRKEGYQVYTQTDCFKLALASLENLAKEKRSCIVCCERFPSRCHRRFITANLHKKFKVVHIIEISEIIEE